MVVKILMAKNMKQNQKLEWLSSLAELSYISTKLKLFGDHETLKEIWCLAQIAGGGGQLFTYFSLLEHL